MYRVIAGVEDLYYERVDEFEVMVFENYDDAAKFTSDWSLEDPTEVYIKIIDDDGIIRGYKRNENKLQVKRNIGFA